MIRRDDFIAEIEQYFTPELIQLARTRDQYMANGIQILGKEDVRRVIVGVSATMEFFSEAKKHHADFILVKHPLVFISPNQLLDPSLQARLRMVFQENWTIGGYHHILDIHPEVGNAPILIEKLGATRLEPFYDGWGYVAEFEDTCTFAEVQQFLEKIVNHAVFAAIPNAKKTVKRFGVVSGGGRPAPHQLMEMLERKLDLYITGEVSEWAPALFKEAGIAYFSAGHHATEVFGPERFAAVLQKRIGNQAAVQFINVWNEI